VQEVPRGLVPESHLGLLPDLEALAQTDVSVSQRARTYAHRVPSWTVMEWANEQRRYHASVPMP